MEGSDGLAAEGFLLFDVREWFGRGGAGGGVEYGLEGVLAEGEGFVLCEWVC